MKKIEAVIQQEKLEEVKAEIDRATEATGMTVMQVLGCGRQKGFKEYVRGQEVITTLLPKVALSFVVKDSDVDYVIDMILNICGTEEVGNGKIFITNVEEVIRIRTGERGQEAI